MAGAEAAGEHGDDRATVRSVVADLLTNHHRRVREELERLEQLLRELRALTGDARVVDFEAHLLSLGQAARAHLEHEERAVFPACLALAEGHAPADPRRFAADCSHFCEGHEGFERDLPRLLFSVRAIPVPAAGVPIRDALLESIRGLCSDLPLHRMKEERLLLPAARRLAAAVPA